MEALSDGIRDCRRHVIGLEQDLMIVEAQDGEAAQGESSISPKIPAAIGCLVMSEPVELNGEAIADQPVQRVSVDPDLLRNGYADAVHEMEEVCFDPRVGQERCHLHQPPRPPAPPLDALQHVPVGATAAQR